MDATYYALPNRHMGEVWLERTPPDFVFDIKAHALMTGQPSEAKRLPKEIREEIPLELADKKRIYGKDLPAELYDAIWDTFLDALKPLYSAGKLGAVFLQYPRWFFRRTRAATIVDARRTAGRGADGGRVPQRDVVQREERRPHPALPGEVPDPVRDGRRAADQDRPAADHGRYLTRAGRGPLPRPAHRDVEAKNIPVVERFRYLYDDKELGEWVLACAERLPPPRTCTC